MCCAEYAEGHFIWFSNFAKSKFLPFATMLDCYLVEVKATNVKSCLLKVMLAIICNSELLGLV